MKRFLTFSAVVFAVLFLLTGGCALTILNRYDDMAEREQIMSFAMNLDILNYTEEEIVALDRLCGVSLHQSYRIGFSEVIDEETARKAADEVFNKVLKHRSPEDIEDIELIYSEKHGAWFAKYGMAIVMIKAENAEVVAILQY